jgi:hypothetical protein
MRRSNNENNENNENNVVPADQASDLDAMLAARAAGGLSEMQHRLRARFLGLVQNTSASDNNERSALDQ